MHVCICNTQVPWLFLARFYYSLMGVWIENHIPTLSKAVKYTHRTSLLLWAGDSAFPGCLSLSLCLASHCQGFCLSCSLLWVAADAGQGLSLCRARVPRTQIASTLSWRCVKSSTWLMDCAECLLGTCVGVLICPGCISLTNCVVLLPIMGCVRLISCNVSRVLFSLDNLGQKGRSQVFRILNIRDE